MCRGVAQPACTWVACGVCVSVWLSVRPRLCARACFCVGGTTAVNPRKPSSKCKRLLGDSENLRPEGPFAQRTGLVPGCYVAVRALVSKHPCRRKSNKKTRANVGAYCATADFWGQRPRPRSGRGLFQAVVWLCVRVFLSTLAAGKQKSLEQMWTA